MFFNEKKNLTKNIFNKKTFLTKIIFQQKNKIKQQKRFFNIRDLKKTFLNKKILLSTYFTNHL